MKWQEALRRGSALEDFESFVGKLLAQAQQAHDEAPTWEAAKEALGAKKTLAIVLRNATLDTKEELEYVRAFGNRPDAA